jgi:hypothetical protein
MVCDYEASVSYNRLGVTSVSVSGASIRPDGAGLRLLVQFVGSRPRGLRLPLGVQLRALGYPVRQYQGNPSDECMRPADAN